MNYKACCPVCGGRASRWHLFTSPRIYHRCRSCGANFRLTAAGHASVFAVVVLQVGWYLLVQLQIISHYVAIGLLLATCASAIWLLPYLSPLRLRETQKNSV
jgi:uncharacterized protein (DUF983 family)